MTSCHVTKLEIVEGEFESSFRFRWEGPDWNDALAAVKTQIPPDARSYDPASTRWMVATAFKTSWRESSKISRVAWMLYAVRWGWGSDA